MDIIATYPSVIYKVTLTDGAVKQWITAYLPEPSLQNRWSMVKRSWICPNENIGDMMALISEKRGAVITPRLLDSRRVDAGACCRQ